MKAIFVAFVIIFTILGVWAIEITDTINDRFDTLDERLDTIQETLTTIQCTLQDSTLILKKKYHNGNVYIDLWQVDELETAHTP